MSELHTANVILDADLADTVEIPARKATASGMLRITLAKIKLYITTAIASKLLPAGGTTGQVLKKIDGTDFNVGWGADNVGTAGPTTLDGLTDVDTSTTAPTNGQALLFNSAAGLWKPGSVASGGGSSGSNGGSLQKLSDTVLATATSTLTFAGIDQSYTDLTIIIYPKMAGNTSDNPTHIRFNDDAGGNYDWRLNSSFENTQGINDAAGARVAMFGYQGTRNGPIEITVYDYADASFSEKHIWSKSSAAGGGNFFFRNFESCWHPAVAAAVTKIDIICPTNFLAGTRVVVYGRGGAAGSVNANAGPFLGDPISGALYTKPAVADFPTQTNPDANYTWADKSYGILCKGVGLPFAPFGRYKPKPAGAFSIYAAFDLSQVDRSNNNRVGIGIYNSVTGRIKYFGLENNSGGPWYVNHANWNSNVSYSGETNLAGYMQIQPFMRLDWDGTNFTFYLGDGIDWQGPFITDPATSWIGANFDNVGILTQFNNKSTVRVLSWSLVAPVAASTPNPKTAWSFKPPSAVSLALASGDATNLTVADDSDEGLLIDSGAPVSGDIQRLAYRTLSNPAGDFDFIVKIDGFITSQQYSNILPIALWDSVGGRVQTCAIGWGRDIAITNWNGTVGFSSTPYTSGALAIIPKWFRVRKVGTALTYSVSSNGKQWADLYTTTATAWLANNPNRIGVGMNLNRSSGPHNLMVVSYLSLTGSAV